MPAIEAEPGIDTAEVPIGVPAQSLVEVNARAKPRRAVRSNIRIGSEDIRVPSPSAWGGGLGVSHSVLTGTTIPGSTNTDLGGSWTLGYQFLAGVQGNLTSRIFLFGEYKYFFANYHWEQLAFDFRTQYLLGGIGWRF